MKRNKTKLIRMGSDQDDGYVDATPEERIAMVEEITKDAWTWMGVDIAQQRLQRNVTKLIRREG